VQGVAHRLAVLDVALAGPDHTNRDGLVVLEALQRQDPGCASIVLTGFATVELAVSVILEMGAFTCLRKETFRRDEFHKVVNAALAAVPAATPAPTKVQPPTAGERALLVEDDAGWRSLLGELLGEAGYSVDACVSYIEALGLLRSQPYHLAVVYLVLANSLLPQSNLDGLRLLSTTLKAGVDTIIVSGFAEPAEIEKAYAAYNLRACLEKRAFDRQNFVALARRLRQPTPGLPELTGREKEVLGYLAQGLTNKEIALKMGISTNTVKRHLKSLFARLGVNTRAGASALASRIK
jgi:DNA-binding NarL/FixJ family response regulator